MISKERYSLVSDSRIWFFTSALRCPNLGFDFSRVFYVIPTWDGVPLPLLRPRLDVAGVEWVSEYLKQRFVPGVGVCFLLVFVVEESAFGVA